MKKILKTTKSSILNEHKKSPPISFVMDGTLTKESQLVRSHYENGVAEMEKMVQNMKSKELKIDVQGSKKKVVKQQETLADKNLTQKKIVVHVPETGKETKVLREISNDHHEKILTDIADLEKKYSGMQSKLENLNIEEDETLMVRKDLNEMNSLMHEFEDKNLSLHKQKFQIFIQKLLKRFHRKKKKLLLEIEIIQKNLDNAISSNKEYLMKIEFLETSYSKLLVEFEELQEIKRSIEEELQKYQKNEALLRAELEKHKSLNILLQKENRILQEKNDALENEKNQLLEENKRFLAKFIKFESENALYKLELEKMKEIYNEKIVDLKKEISELQKANKAHLDEIAELKKDLVLQKSEIQEVTKERDRLKEEVRELEFLLKDKVMEINNLKIVIEKIEKRPPVQVVTEIPVEKRIEIPVEKLVETIKEVPVERVIEVPVEKIVEIPVERIMYVENDEQIRRMDEEIRRIIEEITYWKNRCLHVEEVEFKGIMEERNSLLRKIREAEGVIQERNEKLNRLMGDMAEMRDVNQEKNLGMVQYIESLLSQNQYLESLVINR